jgi:tetratricopeptide (TPR) repeat protein
MIAQDAHARALYLRARALIDAGKLDEAEKALAPALAEVEKHGSAITPEMKAWGASGDEMDGAQKAKILKIAEGVDRAHVEVILAGFRLRVRQGKAADGAALLDLMVKAGGSIEEHLPVLELLGREMAGKMLGLQKEGKKPEADALGAGLAVLLKRIRAVPKLSPTQLLFIGQMLVAVKEYPEAMETLKKVPEPEFPEWKKTPLDNLPMGQERLPSQIRDYSAAQLYIARALKESKKFDEAEKFLQAIIGPNDKPGWGSGRLYFRKELASVYEGKGEALAGNVQAANTEWGKALREWTTLFNLQKNRLTKITPTNTPEEIKQWRNAYADAYFDVQRCLVKANVQLLKDPAQAARLQKTYDDVGKRFADMEKDMAKQNPPTEWESDVQHRYADYLKEVPALLAPYKANGGKLFLERLP